MDRSERFYIIAQMLQQSRGVSKEQFLQRLEVSLATFKRDLAYLRDRMGMPIEFDVELRVYRLPQQEGESHELPGLWFNESELYALLSMQGLLESIQPGMLAPHLEPLAERIQTLLGQGVVSHQEIQNRVKVVNVQGRRFNPGFFAEISQALLQRRRLQIQHYNRSQGSRLQRELSPQRLVHYRGSWYLDAWCHLREALRTFSLDAMQSVDKTDEACKDVSLQELQQQLDGGYGIFRGEIDGQARLRFSAKVATWVRHEQWHPKQRGQLLADGSYELQLPYANPTELIMDVLRYGPEVKVLEPPALKQAIAQQLRDSLQQYV